MLKSLLRRRAVALRLSPPPTRLASLPQLTSTAAPPSRTLATTSPAREPSLAEKLRTARAQRTDSNAASTSPSPPSAADASGPSTSSSPASSSTTDSGDSARPTTEPPPATAQGARIPGRAHVEMIEVREANTQKQLKLNREAAWEKARRARLRKNAAVRKAQLPQAKAGEQAGKTDGKKGGSASEGGVNQVRPLLRQLQPIDRADMRPSCCARRPSADPRQRPRSSPSSTRSRRSNAACARSIRSSSRGTSSTRRSGTDKSTLLDRCVPSPWRPSCALVLTLELGATPRSLYRANPTAHKHPPRPRPGPPLRSRPPLSRARPSSRRPSPTSGPRRSPDSCVPSPRSHASPAQLVLTLTLLPHRSAGTRRPSTASSPRRAPS